MRIINGDCLEVLKTLPDESVDSIVTDPPYELGFMGKKWDNTGIAYNIELWKECLRVLKSGGHLLAFSGTRTYHRMAVAIEDAGFEVRDMIEWVYSTGFPKSLNIYKQLEKNYGSQPKAKYELRLVQETDLSKTKSIEEKQGQVLQSVLSEQSLPQSRETTNNDWREKSSVEGRYYLQASQRELQRCNLCALSERISKNGEERWLCYGTPFSYGSSHLSPTPEGRSCPSYRPQSEQQQYKQSNAISYKPSPQEIRGWEGWGTALKPAHEPICMARKPLAEKTVALNVLKYGTGGINIDESRVESNEELGRNNNARTSGTSYVVQKETMRIDNSGGKRFPANLIHDNSEEVRECFPESNGRYGAVNSGNVKFSPADYGKGQRDSGGTKDSGNASRFFKSIIYTAKADKTERSEYSKVKNNHPTVKPVELMEYLINMVTPKGGTVLDPFMGSGTTGVASKNLSREFIGIELDPEYFKIAESRINNTISQVRLDDII